MVSGRIELGYLLSVKRNLGEGTERGREGRDGVDGSRRFFVRTKGSKEFKEDFPCARRRCGARRSLNYPFHFFWGPFLTRARRRQNELFLSLYSVRVDQKKIKKGTLFH